MAKQGEINMQTFIYSFRGVWPVGAYIYIRANDQGDANKMFKDELKFIGKDIYGKNVLANGDLDIAAVQIRKIKPGRSSYVISNGEY